MPKPRIPRKQTKKASSDLARIEIEVDNSVAVEERRNKLGRFLVDFDNQVLQRREEMQDEGNRMCNQISRLFTSELMKIPKAVRSMPYAEFKTIFTQCDGKIELALLRATQAEFDVVERPTTIKRKYVARATEQVCDTALRRGTRRCRGREESTTMMATATRTRGRIPNKGLDTPLETPMFDHRLPRTQQNLGNPAARARYTLINDDDNSPKIVLPLNGKTVVLGRKTKVNAESKKALQGLQNLIADIMK